MASYVASLAKQGSLGIALKPVRSDSEDEDEDEDDDEDDDDRKPVFGLHPGFKKALYLHYQASRTTALGFA
jgi:hypothetical protein